MYVRCALAVVCFSVYIVHNPLPYLYGASVEADTEIANSTHRFLC